ncbi:MAG: histidine triad nucleotide-binding protein [bacterium]|nr:histidine triad nucleotide-binding protein [bacterium]
MEDCIFCKIVNKEIPSTTEYEDEQFLAFHDIHPKSPLHLLLVPKKHIHSVDHLEFQDRDLMGDLVLTAQKIAKGRGLRGYQLHINVGRDGGQVVDHLHMHLQANI